MKKIKGIAIAGPPASGKSSLARELHARISNSTNIEISALVIQPLLNLPELPETYAEAVRLLVSENPAHAFRANRSSGREIHAAALRKYGSDAIGKFAVSLLENKFSGTFPIISGIRTRAAALPLRESGYFLIYLAAPENILIRRISARDTVSEIIAQADLREEERAYAFTQIEPIANLVITTSGIDIEEAASLVIANLDL